MDCSRQSDVEEVDSQMVIAVFVSRSSSTVVVSRSRETESNVAPRRMNLYAEKMIFAGNPNQLNLVSKATCSAWVAAVLETQKGSENAVDNFVLEIDRCS